MNKASQQTAPLEPEFLLDWNRSMVGRRWVKASVAGSVAVHLLAVAWLVSLPAGSPAPVSEALLSARSYDRTPLVAPPSPQPASNPGPAARRLPLPPVLPPAPLPKPAVAPPVPVTPEPEPASIPDPEPTVVAPVQPAPPAVSNEAEEPKPALAFETPSSFNLPKPGVSSGVAAAPRIQVPDSSIEGAVRQLSRKGTGVGMVIGDTDPSGSGRGVIEARGLPPSPGKTGSSLQLLSDTNGVDFEPYLIQILASVRRNWYVVMPESARLGRTGRVVIQLAIDTEGNIPKLVIASSSGADPLDRAAVAGITASEPFPPLPAEFTGDEVRIQFNFQYSRTQR